MFRSLSVAAGEDQEQAVEKALELNSLIDKAASRGVIHANNAAHKKAKVAAMVALPEGTGLPNGPDKTDPNEGNASKAERRAERGKARHTKKVEARASARARANAEKAEAVAESEAVAETAAPADEAAPAEEAPAGEAAAEEAAAEPEAETAPTEEAVAEPETDAPAEEAPGAETPAEEAEEAPAEE
jgi:hypothetical protein